MKRRLSLGIFALITVSAPIAFGGMDRSFQVLVAALLAVGMLLGPPAVPSLGKWQQRLVLLLIAIMVGKEFLPTQLFAHSHWRSVATDSLGLSLSWMHHPEPARALDNLFIAVVALLWFCWVRTLGSLRENRQFISWTLFLSAAILAVVCLAMPKGSLIYGFRMAPGWMGFGPFPNRNHTANFLAMGLLIGIGCCVHSARRKKFLPMGGALLLLGLIFFTLIQSKSRGAISACAIGLVFYAILAIAHGRNRKTLAIVSATALAGCGLFMLLGSGLIARFSAGGDLPTNLRWGIWRDAIEMWKNAPLFGHGIGSFAQLFPFYQTVSLENQVVFHPESSWLQWLVEFGIIPVGMAATALFGMIIWQLKADFVKQHGFLAKSALFAAAITMVAHCLWDVPGHRWATAGFALAALALACPIAVRTDAPVADKARIMSTRLALLPCAIALFWSIPLFCKGPSFSPATLTKLLQRLELAPARVSSREMNAVLSFFPLSPELQNAMGMRWLNSASTPSRAWHHFQIADRLRPASWTFPARQAIAAQIISPGMALHFWTLAIERAGHRNTEIFTMAYRHTRSLPAAESFWARYAETNPQFLLTYAQELPENEAKFYYTQWVKSRSETQQLGDEEVSQFYAFAERFGELAQFTQWMKQQPGREKSDFRAWIRLLHRWGDDANAWKLVASHVKEPAWPPVTLNTRLEALELNWLKDPGSVVNAQALADAYQRAGDLEGARKVILRSASEKNAPTWFLQKAAFIHAAEHRFADAVDCFLRISEK